MLDKSISSSLANRQEHRDMLYFIDRMLSDMEGVARVAHGPMHRRHGYNPAPLRILIAKFLHTHLNDFEQQSHRYD